MAEKKRKHPGRENSGKKMKSKARDPKIRLLEEDDDLVEETVIDSIKIDCRKCQKKFCTTMAYNIHKCNIKMEAQQETSSEDSAKMKLEAEENGAASAGPSTIALRLSSATRKETGSSTVIENGFLADIPPEHADPLLEKVAAAPRIELVWSMANSDRSTTPAAIQDETLMENSQFMFRNIGKSPFVLNNTSQSTSSPLSVVVATRYFEFLCAKVEKLDKDIQSNKRLLKFLIEGLFLNNP